LEEGQIIGGIRGRDDVATDALGAWILPAGGIEDIEIIKSTNGSCTHSKSRPSRLEVSTKFTIVSANVARESSEARICEKYLEPVQPPIEIAAETF